MALQKQQLSVALIEGSNTKTNSQISQSPQDMVNVVFTGNTTAKKMNGYDLIATLPSNEYYSSLFTRDNDLIAQTEKGAYKYNPFNNSFSKISGIGSSSIEKVTSYGEVYCSNQNFDLMVAMYNINGVTALSYTFLNKDGGVFQVINEAITSFGFVYTSQIDVFKHMIAVPRYVNGSTFGSSYDEFITLAIDDTAYGLRSFKYDSGTNAFVKTTITPIGVTIPLSLDCINIYCDHSPTLLSVQDSPPIFIAIKDSGAGYGFVHSLAVFTTVHLTPEIVQITLPGGGAITGSFQLFKRTATSIRLTVGTDLGAMCIENFSYTEPLTTGAAITPTVISKNIVFIGSSGPSYYYSSYPTSDTTAVCFQYFMNDAATNTLTYPALPNFQYGHSSISFISNSVGLLPVSEIFYDNGEYYCHFIKQIGLNCINYIINIGTGSLVGTFGYSKAIQKNTLSDTGETVAGTTIIYSWNVQASDGSYSLKKAYKNSNYWTLCTRDILPATSDLFAKTQTYHFSLDAKIINTNYEVTKKSVIFNGQPAYYDGVTYSEFGINCPPVILGIKELNTGGVYLPTASNWQFTAVYSWKDINGNIFYSDISNIVGLGINIATVGVTFYEIELLLPANTEKLAVTVEIYGKNGGDPFHLVGSGTGTSIQVKTYSNADIKYLYATGTFVNGGDFPVNVLTDCSSSSIFEDRFIVHSGDNPTQLAFSQQRIDGFGAEFNQSIFYLNCYDKRGVYEDKIIGTLAMDGRLFIFKQRSILYITGSGPTRANTLNDFSSPQLVTTDVGCISAKSLVLMPHGIMFMSDKGIYLLDRKLQVSYIGASIERFNLNTITSAILLEKVNEVRFGTLEGEVLVYNYYSSAWSWFTDLPSVAACIWKGSYVLVLSDGRVFKESTSHKKIVQSGVSTAIVQKVSSPWVRPHDVQGYGRVYELFILGEFKTDHQLKVSMYYDYELYASDVYTLTPLASSQYNLLSRPTNSNLETGVSTDGVYQIKIDMIRKVCQSFRVVIEDIPQNVSSNTGECFALSHLNCSIGIKKGYAELPASKTY